MPEPPRPSFERWRALAQRHLRWSDVWQLGAPGLLGAALGLARHRDTVSGTADGLEHRDPEVVELLLDASRFLGERYFRWSVEGVEHVPAQGAALIVGNHNGGLLTFDSMLTFVAIRDHHGPERIVHSLAHDLLFQHPRWRELTVKFGTLRASHDSSAEALRRGRLVLVYPGSELDCMRPFRERHRVELGGRQGFLKLALRQGVPIVPVVSAGTHEQLIVLSRGDALARALGLQRRLRSGAFPLALALPWGLTSGYLPYWPLPAQTSLRFGPPLSLAGLDPDDPAHLAQAYEQVRSAMQRELDVLARGRVPWLGKPGRRRGPHPA